MKAGLLIRKLERFAKLSDDDKALLEDSVQDVRRFDRRTDLICEGDKPDNVHLVIGGWAARYKVLENGDRPIMAFLIPGDLCDVQVMLLDQMDHAIGTLTDCDIAFISRQRIRSVLERSEKLTRAMWWSTLVDEAILREWLVTVGHRVADKRLAHLFCEMLLRSRVVGLTGDDSFELPLTQEELAGAMGMSTVHINRMMQELRTQNLISTQGKTVTIPNLDRLMEFSGFNPNYLHM